MPLIAIELITIGERIRKDFGDLESLAKSMEEIGQLQPIGVTSEDLDGNMFLVFGERRLRAARDILHWDTIDVKAVDLDAIILGELHENEMRKDFTVSERVAIGKAIEEYLGDRRGGDHKSVEFQSGNFTALIDGRETREIAAEKAGFGSESSYRQAKTIIEQAEPELTQVVDTGKLAVSQAVKAIAAPPETQRQIADLAESGHAKEAREVIQDLTVQQAWQRYPELKAQDIPQKFVPKMAATLDRMDETTREEKRQALQTRKPGVGAELAGLPPIPAGPAIQAQVRAEINSDPATHWLEWSRDVEQGLEALFGRGDMQDLVQRWTPEARALVLQRMKKSFSRWQQLMAALEPIATEGNGHHANTVHA